MLPDATTATANKQGKGGKGQWITKDDLNTQPKEFRILAVNVNKRSKFGTRVELKGAFEGQTKFWGTPVGPSDEVGPNYEMLLQQFGNDENNWVGKVILLSLEQNSFSEKYYPRVSFPTAKSTARR